MLPEKIDEIAHLGIIGSKITGALGDFDESISITRFLYFRKQKIEHNKIEVLNFISAALKRIAAPT